MTELSEFERRDQDTTAAIRLVLDRWQALSPFRSYAEYSQALLTAVA